MKSFKDLEAWKKARELRKEISSLSKSFPIEEKYKLSDQIVRAARSVTANIAEGYGRFHYQENIQFCRIARSSLTEVQDHLTVDWTRAISTFKLKIGMTCKQKNVFELLMVISINPLGEIGFV
ncbi:MAG: hypothetical protein COW03_05910 [Cytophagales bacterium CG12_big_fil_rev_8_21_14_0_65_40_12]|nr:MAG: hypothetical protein COW03_05910 [Cytophagales bacterium CG12_big_fil_rev_8_21_14_0_65_40_12]PIW04736.1 MAG: hypothetical protein COW40_08395 [Cytophagales bacterium CG17_big_fil_post_rev_8_21_14_2_50_40_13]